MKKTAVFFDRDGVLIENIGDTQVQKISFLPKVLEALKLLSNSRIKLIVVTNQPAVVKGLLTEEDVQRTQERINARLLEQSGPELIFYYCPHHPTKGVIKKYLKNCRCRKPAIGLFLKAAKDFSLDLRKCFAVGDYSWDIQAGKKAGCTTILVKYHRRSAMEIRQIISEAQPDYYCEDILKAAKLIVSKL